MYRERRTSTSAWDLRYPDFVMGKGGSKSSPAFCPLKLDSDLVEFKKTLAPGGLDSLRGKGAVVTGTASGSGKAIVRTGEVVEMKTKEYTTIRSARVGRQPVVAPALLLAFVFFATAAGGQEARVQPGKGVTAPQASDVSETGKKLSNPLGDVWALFTEFDLNFSDGNVNPGHQ